MTEEGHNFRDKIPHEAEPKLQPGKLKRLGEKLFRTLFPFQIEPYDPSSQAAETAQKPEIAPVEKPTFSHQAPEPYKTPAAPEVKEAKSDRGKQNLLLYDHLIIELPDSHYYLPLDSEVNILAARVISSLPKVYETHKTKGTISGRTDFTQAHVAEVVDKTMHSAERALFAASKDKLPMAERIAILLRTLTNKLMLTREPTKSEFKLIASNFKLKLGAQPLSKEEIDADALLKPVFPPGTEKSKIKTFRKKVSASSIEFARALRAGLKAGRGFTQEEAIKVLDFVTDIEGRRAIREVYADASKNTTEVLEDLHAGIKTSLGADAYIIAYYNRMIGGHHLIKGGRVQQVSGRLPVTTKWHVGESTRESLRKQW